MLRFLTGKANLTEDFHVAPGKPRRPGRARPCSSSPPASPSPAGPGQVWVDLATDMIARVYIQDFYANTMT